MPMLAVAERSFNSCALLTPRWPGLTLLVLPVEKEPSEHSQAPMALADAMRVRHILAWGY